VIFALSPAASWGVIALVVSPVLIAARWQYRRDRLAESVQRHPGGRS
jgi:hypothetical protein